MSLSLWSADWTPVRFIVTDKTNYREHDICDIKKTKTIGIDLGLWQTGTCMVIGTQIASAAFADKMYGIQFGLLAAGIQNEGYGLQLAGLTSVMESSEGKNYVVQISGLANNPVFWYPPSFNGIQIAGLLNGAGKFNGVQIGLVNLLAIGHAFQAGLCNIQLPPDGSNFLIQFGGYNRMEYASGFQFGIVNSHKFFKGEETILNPVSNKVAQFGIYNDAFNDVKGFQLGIVNRAKKFTGVQLGIINIVPKQNSIFGLPLLPILNISR